MKTKKRYSEDTYEIYETQYEWLGENEEECSGLIWIEYTSFYNCADREVGWNKDWVEIHIHKVYVAETKEDVMKYVDLQDLTDRIIQYTETLFQEY